MGERERKNLTGCVFGMLTAMDSVTRMPSTGERKGDWLWQCRCECGKTIFVRAYALTKGLTRSCGCLRGIKARERAADQRKRAARKSQLAQRPFLSPDWPAADRVIEDAMREMIRTSFSVAPSFQPIVPKLTFQ